MILIRCVSFLAAVAVGSGIEVAVPERYLQPRHFNPHPLQTLLTSPLGLLLDPRGYPAPAPSQLGRQGDSSPVQFPRVPETARPTKSHTPGYITVPKNYAFAYAVKDRQSGDDFSHQQAQNGEGTKGEYRVKLPDGRTQIVSYTADSSGYKADVRYDGQALPQPKYQAKEEEPVYNSPSYQEDDVTYQTSRPSYQENNVPYQTGPSYQPKRIVYSIPSSRQKVGQLLHKTASPSYQPVRLVYNTETPSYQLAGVSYNPNYQLASNYYKTDGETHSKQYPSIVSNSIAQEPDYTDDAEVDYRQPIQYVQKYAPVVGGSPRPSILFSPALGAQNQQLRSVPQSAAEYTSSDSPLYVATPSATPSYYAPPVTSTEATPITEEQEDPPKPRKPTGAVPYPPSSYYSVTTATPPTKSAVRYFLVPNPTQYLYSDS